MENMFSPLKSEFDEKFYHFLCDNFITILHNPKYYGQLSNIQHEYKRILRKFGREVNIIDCIRYLKEVEYFGMKDGNEELAFLCKMCGLPQKTFYDYQEIYETTKKRKESSIPYVEIKNIGGLVTAKMLRLDDPLQLVIGETNLSNCCQKMYGLGESCMLHSTTSSNGRVFTTYDEVGNLLTQSWVWRNGDIICFDNIEASDYFKNHRQKYEHLVIDAYKKVSAELISIDNHLIDEILKKNNSEEINDFANIQKLRAVTVGDVGDHNDIVIDNCFKEICDRRRLPEEQVSYICESDIQRVIFINGETLVDPSSDYKNEAVFRDPRELKKEQGHNITEKTINKIIRIEKEGHLPNMKMHSDVQNANDLASTYGTNVDNLNVIIGEDWYYIYNNNEHDIYVGDLCRTKPRFKDEEGNVQKEIRAAFYQILDDSISADEIKIISVDLREDTSYLLYLWLLKDGIVEQMGEDTRYIFDAPYDEEYITKNHQQEYLRNIKQIRDKKDDEEVYMHKLSFRPSNKYIEKFHPELMNMCMSR
jgi:hypothetical protein